MCCLLTGNHHLADVHLCLCSLVRLEVARLESRLEPRVNVCFAVCHQMWTALESNEIGRWLTFLPSVCG